MNVFKRGALCYKFLTWRASTMAPVCVPVFMATLASGICELSWNLHIDATWSLRIALTSTKVERWGVYFKIWMLFKKHSLPKEGRVKDTLAPFSHALMISILWIWEQFSGLRFSNPIIWLEILTLTYFTFLVCHLQKIWHSENPHYWHK